MLLPLRHPTSVNGSLLLVIMTRKSKMMAYVPTLLVVIACFIPHSCVADGVFGCGGFVKSDVEINYSLVEVRHSRSIIIMNLARLDLV